MSRVSTAHSRRRSAPQLSTARRLRAIFRQALFVSGIVFFLVLVSAALWFYNSGKPGKLLASWAEQSKAPFSAIAGRMGLTLQHIYLEGMHHTERDSIIKALDIRLGQPILPLSLPAIKERLENIDWVRHATVERQLPNTLHIRIIERKPLAIWQRNGKLFLIDEEGHSMEEDDLKPFSGLLIMVGDDAPLYAESLLEVIKEDPSLFSHITAAIRIGERRWNIRFANGLEVKLPEQNLTAAWRYVIKLDQQKKLFLPTLKTIDLRIADKLYMNIAPDTAKLVDRKEKEGLGIRD